MPLSTRQQKRKVWLEQAIEAIEGTQLGIITSGKSEMAFNGRSITNLSPIELEALRKKFELELEKLERKDAGLSVSGTVRVVG